MSIFYDRTDVERASSEGSMILVLHRFTDGGDILYLYFLPAITLTHVLLIYSVLYISMLVSDVVGSSIFPCLQKQTKLALPEGGSSWFY